MSARVKQQADQMHALTAERDDLHTQVVNLQADALVQKAKVTELETRYQQEIPSDTVRALMLIVKDKLAAGVTPERLTTILTAAGNVRNCREKTVKRFLLSTSLNQGKDSSASFAAGSITITGEGQMAKSEDGKAEAWFDAALPVSMKFSLIGGRVSVAEGMLPLQHSIIDDTIEYRFTVQADATSPGAGPRRAAAPRRLRPLRRVINDAAGAVVQLRCTLLPEPVTEKVAGVIHWVSASRGVRCEVRLYDRLFNAAKPDAAEDVATVLNPNSLEIVTIAIVEPAVVARAKTPIQLEGVGYFIADEIDSRPDALVLNRVITLRDSAVVRSAHCVTTAGGRVEATVRKATRSATRPDRKSGREYRDGARRRDDVLAARYAAAVDALGEETADLLHGDLGTSNFFAPIAATLPLERAKSIARWVVNEVPRVLPKDLDLQFTKLTPENLNALVELVENGTITAATAKELLGELVAQGGDPVALVDARGLRQVAATDDLAPIIAAVLAANPAKVAEYRGGKAGLLGFFVGQVMKASGGKANPASVNQLVAAALAG